MLILILFSSLDWQQLFTLFSFAFGLHNFFPLNLPLCGSVL